MRSLPHPVPPPSPGIGEKVQESVLRVSVPWRFRLLGMAPWKLGGAVTHGLAVVALPHNRYFLGRSEQSPTRHLLSALESLAANAQVAHLNVYGSSVVGGVRGVCARARGSAWADGTAEAYSLLGSQLPTPPPNPAFTYSCCGPWDVRESQMCPTWT